GLALVGLEEVPQRNPHALGNRADGHVDIAAPLAHLLSLLEKRSSRCQRHYSCPDHARVAVTRSAARLNVNTPPPCWSSAYRPHPGRHRFADPPRWSGRRLDP